MRIEIVARRDDSTVWHVLVDYSTVTYIRRVGKTWRSDGLMARLDGYSVAQHAEITAAVKEKITLLNIVARLTP